MVATQDCHRIDTIGGVRCKGCDKPLMKAVFDPGNRPKLVLFVRCKPCGFYNIVDFEVAVLE